MIDSNSTSRSSIRASVLALVLASTSAVSAAQICLESATTFPIVPEAYALTAADLDRDGDLDLAAARGIPSGVTILWNDGMAGFTPGPTLPAPGACLSITSGDFDGDGDADLATANVNAGFGLYFQQPGGVFSGPVTTPAVEQTRWIVSGDLDQDGDLDLVTLSDAFASPTISIRLNTGTGVFAAPVPHPVGSQCQVVDVGDVDGDLDLDLVVAEYGASTVSVLRNVGGGTFAPRVPWSAGFYPSDVDGADLDGDGDLDWAVADAFSLSTGAGSRVVLLWNDGTGAYPGPTLLPSSSSPRSVRAVDLDGDGRVDLAVLNASGNLSVFQNLGGGAFAAPLVIPLDALTLGLTRADLDDDGDEDLAAVQSQGSVEAWRNCSVSGVPTCLGDGSGTACPCGNTSAAAAQAGCLNSFGLAPTLRASGSAQISQDGLVLAGGGMPNSSALYIQGTSVIPGGAVFGDGLRCAGGTVVRLGTRTNFGHASEYPGAGDPTVSVRGGVLVPGTRVYQTWFRDPATFCTSATFGLTNALTVVWRS